MPRIQDDPKDVLAFLNSLGFIGVTAPQLQLFMKDLKLYRKIKQKEQREWKERVKEKLRNKQWRSLDKVLQRCESDTHSSEQASSESVTSKETSSIKIYFQYSAEDKENKHRGSNSESEYSDTRSNRRSENKSQKTESPARVNVKTCNVLEELSKLNVRQQSSKKSMKVKQKDREKDEPKKTKLSNNTSPSTTQRVSRSRARIAIPESARTQETQRSSSRSKSFIRPWKLQQTDSQQSLVNKKSDPVSLYHHYQQEWNKLSLPGEQRHDKIRWEMREKMLGSDPVPRPVLRKSASSVTVKKKPL